jgi:glycosyltransferase involved in cell wall biosynthesis
MPDVANITFLVSSAHVGGAETALSHLLQGLNRARFHSRLVCLRREPGRIARELQSNGIPLVFGLSRARFDPMVGRRLVRTLGERVDILYCLGNRNVLFWVPYLLRRMNIRSSVVICQQTRNLHGGPSFGLTDRPALRRVQRIIAVAHKQKRHLVEQEGLPEERIEVIHNAISAADFADLSSQLTDRARLRQEWGLREEHKVAMIVATLRPEKNHERFLRIARAVAMRMPEARFVVVGDGVERAKLESYAQALGVTEVVRFVGVRRDVPQVLAAADVVTLTSDDRVETFPLALLEAMAAARPVVATRVGSLEEMVIEGETGHLIPVDGERSFADALHRVLSDPVRARAMGEAGRRCVLQHFTAEQMVRAHEELFEQLLRETSMKNRVVQSAARLEI